MFDYYYHGTRVTEGKVAKGGVNIRIGSVCRVSVFDPPGSKYDSLGRLIEPVEGTPKA